MTSWHGHAFCVTDLYSRKSQTDQGQLFWDRYICCDSEQAVEQTIETLVIRYATKL